MVQKSILFLHTAQTSYIQLWIGMIHIYQSIIEYENDRLRITVKHA